MPTKYRLKSDSQLEPRAKAGTIVYGIAGHDYGLASDDSRITGVPHTSVTLDPQGGPPSFTIPTDALEVVKTLRDRCKEMLSKLRMDGMLRQGDPVEDLMAFVLAEKGRAADGRLEESMPLVLYFANDADRKEFISVVQYFKPGMMAKEMP